jgi:hypothetical protein
LRGGGLRRDGEGKEEALGREEGGEEERTYVDELVVSDGDDDAARDGVAFSELKRER